MGEPRGMRWKRILVGIFALGAALPAVWMLLRLHPGGPVSVSPIRTFLPLLHLVLLKPAYWTLPWLQPAVLAIIAVGVLLSAALALVVVLRAASSEVTLRLACALAGVGLGVAHLHFVRAAGLLAPSGVVGAWITWRWRR